MTFLLALVLAIGQSSASLVLLEQRVTADPKNLKTAAEYRQAVLAADDYDRAIHFFSALADRPGAGPHALLNLGLAYIDKIPAVGAFRRISLGDGYWRLTNREKARDTWRDGRTRFPDDSRLTFRLTAPDRAIADAIAHDLDAGVRVDTSLHDVASD